LSDLLDDLSNRFVVQREFDKANGDNVDELLIANCLAKPAWTFRDAVPLKEAKLTGLMLIVVDDAPTEFRNDGDSLPLIYCTLHFDAEPKA
jgi:hypothetical protein